MSTLGTTLTTTEPMKTYDGTLASDAFDVSGFGNDAAAADAGTAAPPPPPAEDDEEASLYGGEAEWDEGGPSHCGYSATVHETLMTVGAHVHRLVGDPPTDLKEEMRAVGNWFQEASYATRDFLAGNSMKEDTMEAVQTILGSSSKKDDEKDDEKKQGEDATAASTMEAAGDSSPITSSSSVPLPATVVSS